MTWGNIQSSTRNAAVLRIAVVGQRSLLLEGLVRVLSAVEGFDVVARFGSGDEARAHARALALKLVVVDASGYAEEADELLRVLRHEVPGARFLLLVEPALDALATRLARAGADGLVSYDLGVDQFEDAVRRVALGDVILHPRLQGKLLEDARGAQPTLWLSPREREVMRLAAAGNGNREIGERLELTEGTVKSYFRRLMQRLGARDRTHAVVIALRHGLVDLS